VRQSEVRHVADEIAFADVAAETRVVAAFLGDARDGQAAIIVRRVEQAFRGEGQDLATDRPIHRTRIALLEVGAPTAADQQAIAGERDAFIVEHEGHAALRVPGRSAGFEVATTEREVIAVRKIAVRAFRAARRGNRNLTAESGLQQPRTGHVICMDMRVECRAQRDAELVNQRRVAGGLFENRIDEHRLFASAIGQQVRISRRLWIEQLPEDQCRHRYLVVAAGSVCAIFSADATLRSKSSKSSMPPTIARTKTSAFA
jgi:hypothetical protein